METIEVTLRTAYPAEVSVRVAKMAQDNGLERMYQRIGEDRVFVSLSYRDTHSPDQIMELLATCNPLYR